MIIIFISIAFVLKHSMSSSAVEIEKADMRVAHDEEAESEANKTVLPSESKPEVVKYSLAWFGFDINEDGNQAPKLPYWELFLIFLSFGCRAFGGPVAQITMMKDELVVERKWISIERFNRVFSVYQILPGPEAFELACYFGNLSQGRIGAFLGGLGFALPGVCLMLLWSYIYVTYGVDNHKVQASFRCIQVTVSAFIFRANYKLAEHALYDGTKKLFSWPKGFLCIFCFLVRLINYHIWDVCLYIAYLCCD